MRVEIIAIKTKIKSHYSIKAPFVPTLERMTNAIRSGEIYFINS